MPTAEPSSTSLIPVPAGCPTPEPAAVVFTGTMIGKDDVTQTVRYRIDQIRAAVTTVLEGGIAQPPGVELGVERDPAFEAQAQP